MLGWYFCFVPMPMQMLPTFLLAPFFGCNLPIAIALVWVSNPFTYAPLFTLCYGVGNLMLGKGLSFPDIDWSSLGSFTSELYLPIFLGGQVFGLALGLISYIIIPRRLPHLQSQTRQTHPQHPLAIDDHCR